MFRESLQTYLTGDAPFCQDAFAHVPACFAVMYGWVWDTRITKDGIREKIDTMIKNGIRGFYILPEPAEFRPASMITRLDPPYLSKEFFELVRYAVEYAEKNGMYCWLYDEGGWPSGSACGRMEPDWHKKERTEAFIESTHALYAKALQGCHPGLMFTDEPVKHGYTGTWQEAVAAFRASFLQVADFCHRQGWLTGGHLDKDNAVDSGRTLGYGSALQCLQALDIPGVDVIGWQIGSRLKTTPDWDGDMPFFPRMASSAAAQSGHALALTETFGVYGNAVSPDEMRWVIGAQIVRGINLLSFLTMPYDTRDWFPCHERPLFSPDMPGFGHLHAVTAELERAAYFMAHGKPETDIALLFPQTELWRDDAASENVIASFCRLGSMMEQQGIDFDIIDETTLQRGTAADGSVHVGLASYHRIVIPEGAELTPQTEKILTSVTGHGTSAVHTGSPHLWHKVRRDEHGQLYICIFNHDTDIRTAEIRIDTGLPLYRMNAKNGGAYEFRNGTEVTLQSGEMLLLFASDAPMHTDTGYTVTGQTEAVPLGMQKTAQLVLDAQGARMAACREDIRPTADFASAYGPDFSGEVTYTYTFHADAPCPISISAAGVEDSAQIRLNGRTVGYFISSPYEVITAAEKGTNILTITVANQAANAFVHTDMSQWFRAAQIGPYHSRQLAYERKNCRGGLIGPVMISFLR